MLTINNESADRLEAVCKFACYEAGEPFLSVDSSYIDLTPSSKVPPAASQSDFVAWIQPFPLHEFFPMHDEVAVAQALVPLQLLPPWQVPAFSPAATVTGATENIAAAATARTVPEVGFTFIFIFRISCE